MAYFLKHKNHALETTKKYLADVTEVITGVNL